MPFHIGLTVITFTILSLMVSAQSVTLSNYSTDDGLPSSQVYDIIQDDHGYLWFSTDKGLGRYDGKEFIAYGTSDGLLDNVVFDFHKRPNGDIWCSTNSGRLFKITGHEPIFVPYEFNDSLVKYSKTLITQSVLFQKEQLFLSYLNSIGFLSIDKQGNVLSVPKEPPSVFDTTHIYLVSDFTNEPFFYSDPLGEFRGGSILKKQFLHSSQQLVHKGEALNFGIGQLYCYNSHIEWVYPNRIVKKEAREKVIATGLLDNKCYWIGYRYGGVEVYNQKGEVLSHFLKNKSVTQLFVDHEEHVWISTLEHGVYKIAEKDLFFVDETKDFKISALEKDAFNNLFIGYDNGRVIRRSSTGKIDDFYVSEKGSKSTVKLFNDNGRIYCSSDNLLTWSSPKDKITVLLEKKSRYLGVVNDSVLWGMHHTYRGVHLNKESFFKTLRLKDIVVHNGGIYGSNSHGLYFRSDLNPSFEQQLISGVRIDDLNVCGEYLVLGTNGNGVIILNNEHKSEYHITVKEGLTSNFVSSTYTENDSVLWVCTNRGVNRLELYGDGRWDVQSLTESDGLLSNEVWCATVFNDTAWLGTQHGVNFFPLSLLQRGRKKAKRYFLHWKDIHVNNKEWNSSETSFSYYQNEVKFSFSAISFHDQLTYRYKLKGLHTSWRFFDNTELIFSALSPGEYELIIQTKGDTDKWSDEVLTYSFSISPPFWRTWGFTILIVSIIGLLIYGFFKIRILTYNRDIVRDILKHFLRKIRKDLPSIVIKHNGKEVRIFTHEIHYLKTDRNYLEVYTKNKKYTCRLSINEFFQLVDDKIEFMQVHRSYIVRVEYIQQIGKKELVVLETEIPIGRKYQENVKLIGFSTSKKSGDKTAHR